MLFDTDSGASGGYQIPYSLRFDGSNDYVERTPSASNRKTWTISFWVKRSKLGSGVIFGAGGSVNDRFQLLWSSDALQVLYTVGGSNSGYLTTPVYRDVSSWYHVVLVVDTTQSTAADRYKLYVNGGSDVARAGTPTYPSLNADLYVNSAVAHRFGADSYAASNYFDGYLSEINFIDGQALTAGDFGYTDAVTGQWRPKKYTGTYGTNGFYLDFKDGSSTTTLGYDAAGSNDWTLTNMTRSAGVSDCWMTDTPTNNFSTMNPLDVSGGTVSNGGLTWVGNTAGARHTLGVASGVWYWEATVTSLGASVLMWIGVQPQSQSINSASGATTYRSDGQKATGSTPSAYGATYTSGDVIGVAYDANSGNLTFYKNNVSQGVISGVSPEVHPYILCTASVNNSTVNVNFGQRSFAYTPPTGYKALCTANLPVPSILNPNRHFDIKTYTGTAASQSITGINFAPDLVWMKSRGRAVDHALFDSVRGVQLMLESNQTGAESTETTGLTAVNSDGWTMGALDQINGTTATNSFVGWAWKANGAAVTNTSGSITSQVSANTTAGFSIVTYTGTGANATVGHGLGVAPKMVIVKCRGTTATSWIVLTTVVDGSDDYLVLNSTVAKADSTNTPITSSTFGVNTSGDVNGSTRTYVAYCFAEVPGFSKFGSVAGNASADNAFVWCGFRPKYILMKNASLAGTDWIIYDTARATSNVVGPYLRANTADLEASATLIDILSNGFKLRSSGFGVDTFIFAAFAEYPFNYANAR